MTAKITIPPSHMAFCGPHVSETGCSKHLVKAMEAIRALHLATGVTNITPSASHEAPGHGLFAFNPVGIKPVNQIG